MCAFQLPQYCNAVIVFCQVIMHVYNCMVLVYVKALPQVLHVKYSTRCAAERLIKHEAKMSALLALRPGTKCFIFHIARARQCFNYFVEFQGEHLDINVLAGSLRLIWW